MIKTLYKISLWVLALLLMTMTVLISVVGVTEGTLKVLGWITAFFIVSSLVLYLLKRKDS